ncbi:UbiH/UbiF/VisC/COQ6 family ubiquinone biosynthesis hydroxylase [Octadecabacter sp. 1_MG-2023]|uniref:UbiH/UbiF/VisC/COQ6 family ubiquinone biosynthesis hydroxylase n=1 Tax=unclassified Octadecabacter TaxID=196158 RepID=UPI001C093AF1|nr:MULTISPECIES: UbiH/UbiF/VisC/COQ6 family ubiquinone biosynthesis hydroxylase [unclassified Octadecabacter]MBU2992149.1 UbiH/UbiF/VisC/COQ6 family ubiquinone biosynthesis hydroxylase [Octadecabacter sp. B2R22]MDO6735095.1 UbiH/UbiF/VisC/COQ6 family ubiquinone biosynthesis hydroxylase [Octadecabacter sp. 1_MG-2023]
MNKNTDIIIVGGGLNGPILALALAQIGLRSTVIDTLPAQERALSDFDGRSYALALASMRLLRAVGLWDGLKEHAQPMLEIKVTDGTAGNGPAPWMMHFDHGEIEEGPMGYMCEDRYLRQTLLAAMDAETSITQISGDTVVAQSGGTVTLASGDEVTGKLIIGADGRKSGTAERAGIKRDGWDYGQTAIVCAVGHEKPHSGIAHQFFMPHGPLAILPLTRNRCSIVWSETHARAAEIMTMDDADFLDALRPAFGSFLGDISVIGKRFSYPLNLTLAKRFIADRIALIGDAAHGVHPIAGQGLNAGLRDVAVLVDVLQDAKMRGEDIGSPAVLTRYEQWRRFDTTTLAAATDTFNKLFSNDNPLLRAARDIGMGIVNSSPNLRRRFIREAAGLSGDLPSLMKG